LRGDVPADAVRFTARVPAPSPIPLSYPADDPEKRRLDEGGRLVMSDIPWAGGVVREGNRLADADTKEDFLTWNIKSTSARFI